MPCVAVPCLVLLCLEDETRDNGEKESGGDGNIEKRIGDNSKKEARDS